MSKPLKHLGSDGGVQFRTGKSDQGSMTFSGLAVSGHHFGIQFILVAANSDALQRILNAFNIGFDVAHAQAVTVSSDKEAAA